MKVIKIIGKFIVVLIVLIIVFFIILTVTDFSPEKEIILETKNNQVKNMNLDEEYSMLSFNIGYGALSENEEFFMDDGEKVRPENKKIVDNNIENILNSLDEYNVDFSLIQEIDINSKRSYNINELKKISDRYIDYGYNFAKNYDVFFVPVPWPPMGKVESGIATFSSFKINNSKRYQFTGNYDWPRKTVMLDRCFVVSEIEINSSDKKLVIMNAHFSAYDDGSLRIKQLNEVKKYMEKEYAKGNYVIVGGDWNQTFEFIDLSEFPLYKNGDFYLPYPIKESWKEESWEWGVGTNAPTYRLLNAPYEKGITQVGIIDGFLVSPNIEIKETKVIDEKFKYSDHNPVKMLFRLKLK